MLKILIKIFLKRKLINFTNHKAIKGLEICYRLIKIIISLIIGFKKDKLDEKSNQLLMSVGEKILQFKKHIVLLKAKKVYWINKSNKLMARKLSHFILMNKETLKIKNKKMKLGMVFTSNEEYIFNIDSHNQGKKIKTKNFIIKKGKQYANKALLAFNEKKFLEFDCNKIDTKKKR